MGRARTTRATFGWLAARTTIIIIVSTTVVLIVLALSRMRTWETLLQRIRHNVREHQG